MLIVGKRRDAFRRFDRVHALGSVSRPRRLVDVGEGHRRLRRRHRHHDQAQRRQHRRHRQGPHHGRRQPSRHRHGRQPEGLHARRRRPAHHHRGQRLRRVEHRGEHPQCRRDRRQVLRRAGRGEHPRPVLQPDRARSRGRRHRLRDRCASLTAALEKVVACRQEGHHVLGGRHRGGHLPVPAVVLGRGRRPDGARLARGRAARSRCGPTG